MTDAAAEEVEAEVRAFMDAHRSAWERFDLGAVVASYATPASVARVSGLTRLPDEAAKQAYFGKRLDSMRATGPHTWTATRESVTPAGRCGAVYAVHWVCRRPDGSVVEEFGDTYLLARVGGRWEILGDVVHPD